MYKAETEIMLMFLADQGWPIKSLPLEVDDILIVIPSAYRLVYK